MDKHLKQAPNCGCNMTFKNKKHRTFHMQTVHLKEKVGCTRKVTIIISFIWFWISYAHEKHPATPYFVWFNKGIWFSHNLFFCFVKDCFFLCSSETELQEHTFNKHVKKEIENPPVKPVCDICGHVCHSASNLSVGYLLKCGCQKFNFRFLNLFLLSIFVSISWSNRYSTIKYHKTMKHDHVLLVCPHCPKKFNKTAMHAHIKKVHSGFNMCPVCGAKVILKNIYDF